MSQELTDNPLGIWGLGVWVLATFYKRVAPLGLKNVNKFSSYTRSTPLERRD